MAGPVRTRLRRRLWRRRQPSDGELGTPSVAAGGLPPRAGGGNHQLAQEVAARAYFTVFAAWQCSPSSGWRES